MLSREVIKEILMEYYKKAEERNGLYHISKRIGGLAVEDGGVPELMETGDIIDSEYVKWKLIESTVSDNDIKELEKEFGLEFPETFKLLLGSYFHLFDECIFSMPSDNPFSGIRDMFNPILCKFNFLPFAWDKEFGKIRCINLRPMPNEEFCRVYEIDHEILFDLDEENITFSDLIWKMKKVSNNFEEYIYEVFEGDDINRREVNKKVNKAVRRFVGWSNVI